MSTVLVTKEQFVYSITSEYGDYANTLSDRLKLIEVKEQELRKFKIATMCWDAIIDYFSRYNGETAPTDDNNLLLKSEIEAIVILFNQILGTNYWYDFPTDPES